MTDHREDADLRAAFDDLRRETERSVPDFGGMLTSARHEADDHAAPALSLHKDGQESKSSAQRPRPRIAVIGGWATLAAAAAVAGLLLFEAPVDDADAEFEALVASYTTVARTPSPTAGLLDTPGLDLGSVPRIGTAPIIDPDSGVDS